MLGRILAIFALLTLIVSTTTVHAAKKCSQDADCTKPGSACLAGHCKKLKKTESLINIVLSEPYDGVAVVYIDDTYMGDLPWAGIVTAGPHSIRVEAPGMQVVAFQGNSVGGKSDTVPVQLKPVPSPPPKQPQVMPRDGGAAESEKNLPGTFHVGLFGGGNYGTGTWTGGFQRPMLGFQGGLAVGLRALYEPIWLDLSLVVSSTTLKPMADGAVLADGDNADWGDFLKLHMGLQIRLLFPLKTNFFYLGAELEPGYGLAGARWAYADLHLAMSIFINQFIEIRINPLGFEYLQELEGRGYIASFHATLGIAIRFPKKKIF